MKKEIYLEDIEKYLHNCLIELNHDFLKKILVKASVNKEPHKDEGFVNKLGLSFHKVAKRNVGLNSLLRKNRAIGFDLLIKIKKLGNISWPNIEKNVISLRLGRAKGKVYIKFPIKIDRKLGSIIGHVLGDGSIDKKYLQLFFTNQDKELIREFYKNMISIFTIEPRVWCQKPGRFKEQSKWVERITIERIDKYEQIGLFYPSICGKILNSIFGNFAIGKNKNITNEIINTSNEFKIGLIRSFFDDEGHVDVARTLRFHQDNKRILEGIKILLHDLDIESCPIRHYFRKGKYRHFFNISGNKNHLDYHNTIGCTSQYKQESLIRLVLKR